MAPPSQPKIYHIVHVDRLASIVEDGFLWSDATVQSSARPGTTIGMSEIKQRRLTNPVNCRPGLNVGGCVPFYFCPRSVMLYVIHQANHPGLDYRGGQEPIVHLEADLNSAVAWAEQEELRWAFTLSNAGSRYFEDRCDLDRLSEIDWDAVQARNWQNRMDAKQAEFLVERSLPWTLVRRVGVRSPHAGELAHEAMRMSEHQPAIEVKPEWYY